MASAKPKKKNPRLASGRKRVRQDIVINAANTSLRSKYRTAVKNVPPLLATKPKQQKPSQKPNPCSTRWLTKASSTRTKPLATRAAWPPRSRLWPRHNSPSFNSPCEPSNHTEDRKPFETGALSAKKESTTFGWFFHAYFGSSERLAHLHLA
jgi:hypothetical protein